jgi:hypothetical protein
VTFALLSLLAVARAEPDAGAAVETNLRLRADGAWLDFRDGVVFSAWTETSPTANVKGRADIDLRLHNLADFDQIDGASDPVRGQPWSLRFRDAWVRARFGDVTLRAGAQRIAWGVGSGISLLDNVNPWNLEDPTRFDQRLSVPALHLTATTGSLSVEGAWTPFFIPGALPADGVSLTAGAQDVFDAGAFGATSDIEVNELQTRLTMPDGSVTDGSIGGRLRWSGSAADVALSWYHGRDTLPQVSGEVLLTGFQTDTGRVDVAVPLVYPRVDIGGLEVKGELPGDISAWGELAIILPSRTVASPSETQLQDLVRLGTLDEVPDPIPATVTQDGVPFAKWLVGVDRSFGPVYINAQWLHGFPTERKQTALRDYGLVAVRYTIRPMLRLDASAASDLAGYLVGGRLSWLYGDAIVLSAGYTQIGGPADSALGGFAGVSHGVVSGQLTF